MAQNLLTSEEELVEEFHSPRKALVFDGTPESTLDDYLESISKTMNPKNVTHASQIRGNRVCMFFREEDHINQLLKDGGLDIKNSFASCQRFHAEPSKVILSNCLPFISNKKLLDSLSHIGKVMSPITDVPVDTQFDAFKHVKSFRKTVEILFEDLDNAPYKVMVEYRTKSVPIYICVEDLLCVGCQCYGHCVAHCPIMEMASTKKEKPKVADKLIGKRPRVKSAPSPARRASSPITSFFCRHAADLSRDLGLTSSVDFSRESVWSNDPKVACIDDVLNEPTDSDEPTLRESEDSVKTVFEKKSEGIIPVKKKSQKSEGLPHLSDVSADDVRV